ncbi:alkaline ceramidase [Propioniciclava coleopterorum]|uniref:Alkaline ceramidase n=1 Tax=Propioniciclava coleopterorum TaxID=2714937 RepID=A0A6G7Y706_9ACTN|nr:alkaline ceramidase [Propioniciclava coleopterorum]QIK72595.1 alkaline ceramidase [Propioniciclava coleopterorum]
MIDVGAAVREVDVPAGTPMGGFAGRRSPSTGVHDPTTVRALVLGGVGVVAVDACVLHEDTCAAIEAAATGADRPDSVDAAVVSALHTHSGPSIGCGRAGGHAAAVHDAVVAAAIEALDAARASARPATAAWASVRGTGVAKDRRHPERAIDPPLTALRFADADGAVIATLASYPCHPVVLDGTNTLITADYAHPLRAGVEDDSGAPCVFLTGAAGDVNTGHAATASFSSQQASGRTFERAAELGGRLASGLASASWEPLAVDTARFASTPIELGYEDLDPEQVAARRAGWEAEREAADPGQRAVLDIWIAWAGAWRPEDQAEPWRGRVGVIDLGAAAIVTLPGEPFLRVAEDLEAVRPRVMVAGYTDGVAGYLPTADAYPEGGYEVEDACMYYAMPGPFRRGSAELLTRAGRGLLGA